MLSRPFFPNFGQGPLPKIAEKSPITSVRNFAWHMVFCYCSKVFTKAMSAAECSGHFRVFHNVMNVPGMSISF